MQQQLLISISPSELETLIKDAVGKVLEEGFKPVSEEEYPGYLNVDQASAYTHIAKATLYEYTHRKKIPFYKVGKKLLFSKSELQEWVKGHRT